MASSFGVARREAVNRKRVLVLDDLVDSGAAMQEISRVLLRAGAERIVVLALTKTIHSTD